MRPLALWVFFQASLVIVRGKTFVFVRRERRHDAETGIVNERTRETKNFNVPFQPLRNIAEGHGVRFGPHWALSGAIHSLSIISCRVSLIR